MSNNISLSIDKLDNWLESESFKGYDPYDTLNSTIPFSSLGKWIPIVAIQLQKRNPINIRSLIGIPKDFNPKGMGLFLKAYSLLYQITKNDIYQKHANYIFTWLLNHYSEGFSGKAWGYNFDWSNPDGNLKAYTPSVVVTSFVADGLFEYYKTTGNEKAKDLIVSANQYITGDLPRTKMKNGLSIAYSHKSLGCCYNASLLGAETIAKAYFLSGDEKDLDIAHDAVRFVLSMQKENGCWYYSYNPKNDTERRQIDFHQGFILMSLHNYQKYAGSKALRVDEAIRSGLNYYRTEQFLNNGQSKWRLPSKLPVDIHNQAQGIITFAELAFYNNTYLSFANEIADYTIKNMQHQTGYFYYKKHRYYTIRIPYIRWSQAWMLLALATLQFKMNVQT